MKGVVIKYSPEKGYGFGRPTGGGDDIFVHIKQVDADTLSVGQQVIFEIKDTPKGFSAINVKAGKQQKSPVAVFLIAAGVLAFIVIAVTTFYWKASPFVSYLLAINLTTFMLYGYDKFVAGSSAIRVPENILHLLAVMGGTPAAFAAQQFFRHKTVKEHFQNVFWLTVFAQIGLLVFAFWYW